MSTKTFGSQALEMFCRLKESQKKENNMVGHLKKGKSGKFAKLISYFEERVQFI